MSDRVSIGRGGASFMFDEPDARGDPIARFERALARYDRVERMKRNWEGARDLVTGRPLHGGDFIEWLRLPLGDHE